MTLNEFDLEYSYAPSTIKKLSPELIGKMISIRGIYKKDNKKNNNKSETFNDWLWDENSSVKIKVEIPKKLRKTVKHGNVYYFKGTLVSESDKTNITSLKFIIDDFHERKVERDFAVLNEKRNQGFKQPDVIIKNKIKNSETPEIAFIFSNASDLVKEINEKLNSHSDRFQFSTFETDLSSKKHFTDAITEIKKNKNTYDALVLLDESKEDFSVLLDDQTIAEKLLTTKYPLITTTAFENSLVNQISDMKFKTPIDFAEFLCGIVDECEESGKTPANSEQNSSLQSELDLANKTVDELEENVEQLNSQIEETDDKLAELEQMKTRYEQQLHDRNDEVEELKAVNSKNAVEIERLTNELNRQSLENMSYEKKLQDVNTQNNDLANEIMNLKLELEQNTKELGNQIGKRSKIEDELSELKHLLDRTIADKQMIEANKNNLAGELEKLTEKYDSIQTEIEKFAEMSNRKELKIAEMTKNLESKDKTFANNTRKMEAQLEKLKKKGQILLIAIAAIALVVGVVVGLIL